MVVMLCGAKGLIPMEDCQCECNGNKSRFVVELISWQLLLFPELLTARSVTICIVNSFLDKKLALGLELRFDATLPWQTSHSAGRQKSFPQPAVGPLVESGPKHLSIQLYFLLIQCMLSTSEVTSMLCYW